MEDFMNASESKQQYNISEEELKQIQLIQQDLIGEVARICKKCGIHFNMVGGWEPFVIKDTYHGTTMLILDFSERNTRNSGRPVKRN